MNCEDDNEQFKWCATTEPNVMSVKEAFRVLRKENEELKTELKKLNERLLRVEYMPGGVEAWKALQEEKTEGLITEDHT